VANGSDIEGSNIGHIWDNIFPSVWSNFKKAKEAWDNLVGALARNINGHLQNIKSEQLSFLSYYKKNQCEVEYGKVLEVKQKIAVK
jgi:hypothetical protein